MTPPISEIWVYLSASPLLGLTITLLAYQGAFWIYQRTGCNPLANPVLIAVSVLVLFLTLTATSYETYFAGAQFVHFLLGPATVALAIPLYTQFHRVRAMLLPVVVGLLVGSLTAAISAVLVGRLFGASLSTQLSLAPKSVTTPIAMGIAERIGGIERGAAPVGQLPQRLRTGATARDAIGVGKGEQLAGRCGAVGACLCGRCVLAAQPLEHRGLLLDALFPAAPGAGAGAITAEDFQQ